MDGEPSDVAGQQVARPTGRILSFEAERVRAASEIDRIERWATRDDVPGKVRVQCVPLDDDRLFQPGLHAQRDPALIVPVRWLHGDLFAAVEIRHVGADGVEHPGDSPANLVDHRAFDVGTVDRESPDGKAVHQMADTRRPHAAEPSFGTAPAGIGQIRWRAVCRSG